MELPCIVERIIFCKENGFAILAANLNPDSSKYNVDLEDVVEPYIKKDGYNNFTITLGNMNPHENANGGQYIFIGDFVNHEKYGPQFRAEFYYHDAPTTEDGLRAYLMLLPNIKEKRSQDIIRRFGVAETIRILDEDPMRLTEINGLTEKRIAPIAGYEDPMQVYDEFDARKHILERMVEEKIFDYYEVVQFIWTFFREGIQSLPITI